jgi:hypothetical protein
VESRLQGPAAMNETMAPPQTPFLSPGAIRGWRVAQGAVWLVGLWIFLALLLWPAVGLHAFWNVLIPVAPALLVFATGLWRNICPLASTALFPRHMNWSKRKRLSAKWQGWMVLIGVCALLLIVPLRHVVLDLSGPATAIAIAVLAVVAVSVGLLFEWKSGWCSGLCPVHPVEKLYGTAGALAPPNAHCDMCHQCVTPCPDSTPGVHPLMLERPRTRQLAGLLLVGGFAGYIYGWFQVPDYAGSEGWQHLGSAYAWPLGGLAAGIALFMIARRLLPARQERVVILTFAAAAVSCYYWYRLPMLFGFGPHPGDGMLIDLRHTLPAWFPAASRVATTGLFFWWMLGRSAVRRSWATRPHYA